jgi:hypothetical protein
VTVADGRSVVVEVAHDARIREVVQLSFGRVLHPEEVAADKTLALFGRAAARDLVDVAALSERYNAGAVMRAGPREGCGFRPACSRRRVGRCCGSLRRRQSYAISRTSSATTLQEGSSRPVAVPLSVQRLPHRERQSATVSFAT